jgi:hypothetical protein
MKGCQQLWPAAYAMDSHEQDSCPVTKFVEVPVGHDSQVAGEPPAPGAQYVSSGQSAVQGGTQSGECQLHLLVALLDVAGPCWPCGC